MVNCDDSSLGFLILTGVLCGCCDCKEENGPSANTNAHLDGAMASFQRERAKYKRLDFILAGQPQNKTKKKWNESYLSREDSAVLNYISQ
jgi:hypothetical protein